LFSAPLVDLPNIAGTHLLVNLSSAEELLNQEMKHQFIENVNGKTANGTKAKEQELIWNYRAGFGGFSTSNLHIDFHFEISHVCKPYPHCSRQG
jgi:hypothetical protein